MIANTAFLAAVVLLLLACALLEPLAVLAPYKRLIVERYLGIVIGCLAVVFLNLFAVFYAIARRLFLKDTGRKLAHVEKQLLTPEAIVRDLSERLAQDGEPWP
jgi:hypothetical protein